MKLKRLLGASAALAVGASMAGAARADAVANAVLDVTNFRFLNSSNQTLDSSAFTRLTFTDTGNLSAGNTNGSPAGSVGSGGATPSNIGAGGLAFDCLYVGGNCNGGTTANPSPAFLAGPTTSAAIQQTYAALYLNGTPITGLPGASAPARAATAAYAAVAGNGVGNGQSGLTLNSSVTFTTAAAGAITVDFDAKEILTAWDNSFLSATAGNTLSITLISGGVTVFSWAPDGNVGTGITGGIETQDGCNLQATAAIGFPPSGLNDKSCTGHFRATTGVLTAGTTYTLGITQQSIASATSLATIPEPSSVLLAGLALAGMGFAGQRRRQG